MVEYRDGDTEIREGREFFFLCNDLGMEPARPTSTGGMV